MTNEHTPGPWTIEHQGSEVFVTVPNAGEYGLWEPVEDVNAYGNARLIAAAPDLLAAVIEAESWFRELYPTSPDEGLIGLTDQLRDAIAKATGR